MTVPCLRYPSTQSSYSFSDSLPRDHISVSESIWQTLLFISEQESVDRVNGKIGVSLSFHESPNSGVWEDFSGPLNYIVWATASQDPSPPHDIVISRYLSRKKVLWDALPICSVTVMSITQLKLTEVTVIAYSHQSNRFPIEELPKIEQLLCDNNRIITTGDVILANSSNNAFKETQDDLPYSYCRFEIAMTEPVSSGYAIPGKTRFLVLADELEIHDPKSLLSSSVSELSNYGPLADETFTIDENFFANCTSRGAGQTSSQIRIELTGLEIPKDPASFWRVCQSRFAQDFNGSCDVFIATDDLGKLGIFSGDWGIVRSSRGTPRLVRIYGFDHTCIPEKGGSQERKLFASPEFLRNCGLNHQHKSLYLCACSSDIGLLSIPTARSVTLARIASPLSLDRTHYSALLRSLKTFLGSSRQLVKQGDIIGINTCLNSPEIDGSTSNVSIATEGLEELSKREASHKCPACDIAHFVVSSLDYDVEMLGQRTVKVDAFSSLELEKLGCWIDPSVTRVIQTGLEKLPVPDIADTAMEYASYQSLGTSFHKLLELAYAALEESASTMGLVLNVLLTGPSESDMTAATYMVANKLGFHISEVSGFDIAGESTAKTDSRLKEEFDAATSYSPCIFLLRNIEGLLQSTQTDMDKEHSVTHVFQECTNKLNTEWRKTGLPVLLIATTSSAEGLSSVILSCFKHEIPFEVPDESRRFALLKSMASKDSLATDISLNELAVQTAAFTDNDLNDLISQTRICSVYRSLDAITETDTEVQAFRKSLTVLTDADSNAAIQRARVSFSQNIGAPSIPNVSWNDVGGLAKVKQDILDTIQLPLENPSLFADGLKQRSGVLLYGPPGTGKTLLAKAVATSCSLNFFSVKGPELLNMYIGESEANVRRVFQQAREAKPCVIFFDELDSIAPKRGNHGDSGGVMDRIVSQLLAELDGMSSTDTGTDVFVIGATNRPDLLDAALLRPGRFDRLLYLGVSETHEAQLNIIEALTRKFRLDPQLDLVEIAKQCPFNYTGADFYALCSDAMLKAMARKAQSVDATLKRMNSEPRISGHQYPLTPQYYLSELAEPCEIEVVVSTVDFYEALNELVPSVSQSEMEHYSEIQSRFSQDRGKEYSDV